MTDQTELYHHFQATQLLEHSGIDVPSESQGRPQQYHRKLQNYELLEVLLLYG